MPFLFLFFWSLCWFLLSLPFGAGRKGHEEHAWVSPALPLSKKIEKLYPRLLWAVDKGYSGMVERLLNCAASLSSGGPSAASCLVNYSWKTSIFPNYQYPVWFQSELYESIVRYKDSLLHVAASNGSVKIVGLLLAAGATPDPLALDLETPLYFAARYGHVEVMRVLIAHKASVDSANTRGGTPFHRAVLEGQIAAAKLLISHGANITHRQDDQRNVLHEAVSADRVQLVKRLVALSPQAASQWEEMTDQRDSGNNTPLMLACERGNVRMVRLLRRLQVSAGGPERRSNIRDSIDLCQKHSCAANELLQLFPGHEWQIPYIFKFSSSVKDVWPVPCDSLTCK